MQETTRTMENKEVKVEKIKTPYAKILVNGTADKPYYDILWYDTKKRQWHTGYGSYYIHNVFKWLKEEFEVTGNMFRFPDMHAHWIDKSEEPDEDGNKWYICSNCKHQDKHSPNIKVPMESDKQKGIIGVVLKVYPSYAFPEQAAKMMGYKVINDKLTETIKNDIEQDNEILPPEIQALQAEIARKEEYINNQRIIIKDYMDIVTILSDELIKISKHQNGEENPEKTVKSVKNEPDQTITLDELLRQTAEEATELAQSALKLLRA